MGLRYTCSLAPVRVLKLRIRDAGTTKLVTKRHQMMRHRTSAARAATSTEHMDQPKVLCKEHGGAGILVVTLLLPGPGKICIAGVSHEFVI